MEDNLIDILQSFKNDGNYKELDEVDDILHLFSVSKAEGGLVCVHPFKFVVIHGSRCHCLKCGCDVDTQTDC